MLSTALHRLLPNKFLCLQLFWVITNTIVSTAFNHEGRISMLRILGFRFLRANKIINFRCILQHKGLKESIQCLWNNTDLWTKKLLWTVNICFTHGRGKQRHDASGWNWVGRTHSAYTSDSLFRLFDSHICSSDFSLTMLSVIRQCGIIYDIDMITIRYDWLSAYLTSSNGNTDKLWLCL